MLLSIQLARIFSIYFLVVGISMLINRSFFRAAMKEMVSNNVAMLIIASTTLILGIVLVTLHNVWVNDWRVAITLICWVVLFSGVIRTVFPTFVQGMARQLTFKNGYFLLASIVCLVLGVFYGYLGFH
jgi:hypothetical protein